MVKQGRDEYALKARGYLDTMDKFSNFFELRLSYLIFSANEQLSLTLQGIDIYNYKAVSASSLAVSFWKDREKKVLTILFMARFY